MQFIVVHSPDDNLSYADQPAWRAQQALLPPALQLAEGEQPREEWWDIDGFRVHLDRWEPEAAPATLVLIHGGGGNGRLLAPFGAMAARAGYATVAPDLPGYGLTRVPDKHSLRYEDWRDVLSSLIETEAARAPERPIILFGLSMGGMLAYDAAARTGMPAGLVATCFLDVRRPDVRRAMVRYPWMAAVAEPMLAAAPWLTDRLPVPMRLVGNMAGIANDRALSRAIAADVLAGGNWMSAGWLRSFLTSGPLVDPEDFSVCPVLLAHPAEDRWTSVEVSRPFFDRLTVPKQMIMLENAGHCPIEEPGLTQLREALLAFIAGRLAHVSQEHLA